MDFELKGSYLKLDYSKSPISSSDQQDRALAYWNGRLSRFLTKGAGVGLYLSKMAARNARRSYGKIGDCQSNDEREIWWWANALR